MAVPDTLALYPAPTADLHPGGPAAPPATGARALLRRHAGPHTAVAPGPGQPRLSVLRVLLPPPAGPAPALLVGPWTTPAGRPDRVWLTSLPPKRQAQVRTLVAAAAGTGVRAVADHRLVTDGNGYVLRLTEDEWDHPRFERLVLRARGLLEEREAHAATDVLGEALAMWRGTPFCNVRHGSRLTARSRVLNEARLAAREARVDALLLCRRFPEAVGEAVALVGDHPYHENLHAQLMRALYASGRRAAALEVYQSLRRRMMDDLGIPPSPSTTTLHRVMLQDRPDPRHLAAAGAGALL